ncbi:MAG: HD domain-containing protein [Acholeplasmatales bacterium]|nr:HD domain-containing protein [Acholeplasmatales bacterium]
MEFKDYLEEFIKNEKYKELKKYISHGKTTLLNHSINVAYLAYSYAIKKKNKNYDIKSIVRGALLHDFYLYDWHDKNHKRPHGFFHPKAAYENAIKYFDVNKIEENIIKTHMFPLTLFKIPKYKESRLVQKMDKKATFMEIKNKKVNFSLFDLSNEK